VNIRVSAALRGLGVGIATLQPSARTRTHTLVTAYAVGHALDPDGFEVVSVTGPAEPAWAGDLVRAVSSGASWTLLHSLLVPLARRSRLPLPLVALGYAVGEAVTDSMAADWASRRVARGAAAAAAAASSTSEQASGPDSEPS
jgi:hypothetical protein